MTLCKQFSKSLRLLALVGTVASALVLAPAANADLRLSGVYSPTDNPRTPADFITNPEDPNFGDFVGNEGIQEFIEFTFPGFGVPPEALPQETFEEGDETKWDIEIGADTTNPNTESALYGPGYMELDGGSILRYGHLVVGGTKQDVNLESGDEFVGSPNADGYVTVSGFGTVYNSDPELVPSIYAYILATEDEASNDSTLRDTDLGFDVYVGLTGTGQLYVLDGGRVEIQDALLVGVAGSGNGLVEVSGFGSTIDQRGVTQDDGGAGANQAGATVVGLSGSGTLRVVDGGTYNARGGVGIGSGGVAIVGQGTGGASIPILSDGNGNGVVEVAGPSSRLSAAVGLTVGAFEDDVAGYDNGTGSGYLSVGDRALVKVYRGVDVQDNSDEVEISTEPSSLLIGRSGEVHMYTQGRIDISDELVNDGTLGGDGRINLGTFGNRINAEVVVDTDEVLTVSSTGTTASTDAGGAYFMTNTGGLIDVQGGEIEFRRTFTAATDMFFNRIDPGPDPSMPTPTLGRIHGQDATFRFQSGLMNQASLAFTAGDNRVSGDVTNDVTGSILLSGGANAVFEDDLTNLGVIELAPDGTSVSLTVLGNFINNPTSTISLALGGGPTGSQLSTIAVTGDLVLDGVLNVDLSASGITPLDPQPGHEFELISGSSTLTGAFNTLILPTLSDPTWSWGIDTTNSDLTLVVLDVIPIGADFNGDGIVDALDLEIWRMNFGIEMGATGVLGDADGDGDVDGRDYLLWLDQVGGPGMAPPAAITSGSATVANVPEPSTIVLLLSGVAAAWCMRRR